MSLFVDSLKVKNLISEIFEKSGLKKNEADIVADNLVQAEMRGIRSHGLVQVAGYSKLIRSGKINNNSKISIISESPSSYVIDGDFAPGSVSGKYAMQRTIEKAKQNGVAISVVKNGTHFGFAAYYAMDALPENFIGLAFTSTGNAVAPYGGFDKVLGTNPICVVVPAGNERPIIFDAATSNVAYNKCFFAYTEGKSIPDNWAISENGNVTTNPADVVERNGALLPFGGYKGYGLDLIVFIITTLLSGTSVLEGVENSSAENTRKISFNFAAIDISRFTNLKDFKKNVDISIRRIKDSRKCPGVKEIFIPGEIEFNSYENSKKYGLEIFSGVYNKITETLNELGIKKSLEDTKIIN